MSRHEWERGEIKMSVKEFSSVRRDLIAFHNERQVRLFERAKSVYTALKLAGKGTRNFDWNSAFSGVMVSGQGYRMEASDVDGYDEIYNAIFPNEQVEKLVAGQILKGWERSEKPKAPKKNSFTPLKQNADRIIFGEAAIGFDKKARAIYWSTGENNHAVERAREHAMGREFFKRLGRVVWTRGTGGELIGNDEYNEDAGRDYAGAGGSYVTARYGVAEKQFKKSLGIR